MTLDNSEMMKIKEENGLESTMRRVRSANQFERIEVEDTSSANNNYSFL